jgi:hypothetical protein
VVSTKTAVIDHLFFVAKGHVAGQPLTDPVVTFAEIESAINATNPALVAQGKRPLSTNNTANFWKDITRNDPNPIWPTRVLAAGYTGVDAIGQGPGACFRFVQLPFGQTVAFQPAPTPSPGATANPIVLESVSMPLATKALGRTDENWLAQVGARLRVIESHFALRSRFGATEVTFLQTGVKLGDGEVDAAYSLIDQAGDGWLLAVEAKGRRERIHVPQVQRAAAQLLTAALARGQSVVGVLPMAMKIVGAAQLHVVEFDPDTGTGSAGVVVVDSLIELRPTVTGIQ